MSDLIQSFIESLFINYPDSCPMCLGAGKFSINGKINRPAIECPQCKGTGKITKKEESKNV